KIVSVIDDTAANYGGNYADGRGNVYLYEERPDARLKHALFWQGKRQLQNGDIVDLSYRFMFDDWGITSHTLDLRYRWDLGQHYRTTSNYQSQEEVSADYRLGDMDAWTVGLKYGYRMSGERELYGRLSFYQQTNSGDNGFGKLQSQELYPDTTATMLTVGYRF